MRVNKNNWQEKMKAYYKRFWPVQLIIIILTVLSQLDGMTTLSSLLSYLVTIWRNIVHAIFEAPINLLLKLFSLPTIDIPSPIPEAITVFGLLLLSGLKPDQLASRPIARQVDRFRSLHHKILPLDEQTTLPLLLPRLLLDSVFNLLAVIPAVIITGILFGHPIMGVVVLGTLAITQVSLNGKPARRLEDALHVYGFYLCAIILVGVIAIVVTSEILSYFAPSIDDFIEQAKNQGNTISR